MTSFRSNDSDDFILDQTVVMTSFFKHFFILDQTIVMTSF